MKEKLRITGTVSGRFTTGASNMVEQERVARDWLVKNMACQEASPLSVTSFVQCGKLATKLVLSERGTVVYRMCDECADHNIRNRGAKEVGTIEYG